MQITAEPTMLKTTSVNRISAAIKAEDKRKPLKKKPYSMHLLADLESPIFVEDPRKLRAILWNAALAANNTPLKASIHKFPEQGITGIVILAESHIAIHTWPECSYMAVDIFTCGRKSMPYKALEYLKEQFKPKKVKIMFIKRGGSA
jgi:S-adenosylmethionine decarboxylase